MEEASQEVTSTGFSIRPININGEDLIVTQDFNSTRINVTVVDNIITAYSCCGQQTNKSSYLEMRKVGKVPYFTKKLN